MDTHELTGPTPPYGLGIVGVCCRNLSLGTDLPSNSVNVHYENHTLMLSNGRLGYLDEVLK